MHINYLAVVVAGIVSMGIGMLWYSPLMFAKPWLKLSNRSAGDMTMRMTPQQTLITVAAALTASYVMAMMVYFTGASTIASGVMTAFWVWLGFSAATSVSDYLFGGRPLNLFLLNQGFQLVSLSVIGAILAVWM